MLTPVLTKTVLEEDIMNNHTQHLIISVVLITAFTSQPVLAQGSVQHSVAASEHSIQAVGHSIAGSTKLASGVAAVPLTGIGAIGQVSSDAGNALWDIANSEVNEPLPITEETFTAGPNPNQAIKTRN